MGSIVVGVGGLAASNTPGNVIKTLALGSCVAVLLLHPPTRTVGMVHIALPDSAVSPQKAGERPGYFANTGIPALLKSMRETGGPGATNGLIVKMAGGARVMDRNNVFNIGKRNLLAIKKILWQNKLGAVAEDVGGNISRSVFVDVDNGKVLLTSAGRGSWEI